LIDPSSTSARSIAMHRFHPRFWDIAYAFVLFIAIPVGIFHAAQGRWAQAILVTLAAGVGAIILATGWNQVGQTDRAPVSRSQTDTSRQPSQPSRIEMERHRSPSGRYLGWLPMGAVSGFVATGIMTAAVLLGYGISALAGSSASGANQIQQWLSALVNNTVTDIATVNLAAAISIHLVAGVVFAILYAGLVEPRLSGSGLQRGIIFSLIPWALSVTVFFPIIGAGFFGSAIGAGPLPVLGNLVLHIIYGGALGTVYASNAVWKEPVSDVTTANIRILDVAHRGMAIGLVPGAVLGLLTAVVFTGVFTAETDLVMAGVLGAIVGSAVGVWVGSLAGLSPELMDSGDNAPT
jgi:hypothetical protein